MPISRERSRDFWLQPRLPRYNGFPVLTLMTPEYDHMDTGSNNDSLNRGSDRYFTPARLWESFLHTTQKKNREKRQGMRELPPATTRLGTFAGQGPAAA